MHKPWSLAASAFIALSSLFISPIVQAKHIPIEAFASLPDVSKMRLSPDGSKAICLVRVETPTKSGNLVTMFDTKTLESTQLAFSENEKYVITNINWASNEIVLVDAKFPAVRYGTPTTETRLLKIDIATKKVSSVLPKLFLKRLNYIPNILNTVVDYLPEDDNHIIMSMSGFDSSYEETLVQVNISGEGRTKVYNSSEDNISTWILDSQKTPRIAIHRDETTYTIQERKNEDEDLRDLWTFEAFSPDEVWPLGFGKNTNELYVTALHEGKDALFKVNLADKSLSKELVLASEHYDIGGSLKYSKLTGEVIGIGGRYIDEKYKKFEKALDRALPDTTNHILGFSDDENTYIVFATSDIQPGLYLLGNRKEKSLVPIAGRYNALDPELLREKKSISYQARDGLEIKGYLTLPQNKDKNLPTIIFPHGGPISHDSDGFDYWTQFLANRGYAVLQMNFRGSSGYGYDFMKQGLASWGQAMQDDVEDGAKWLIEQGIANKDKMCILGASYGGYAALMGPLKEPELYKCAVSFAGVTDIEYLVKKSRRYTHHEIVKKQIGSDYDILWERSPLKHAKKIKPPVLLIHGSKDRVVNVHHSEEMFDELDDEDKDVTYLEIKGGDHYLSNNEHRLQAFKAIEKFLAKHLGES